MSAAGLSNHEMERIVSGNGLPPRFYYSPEIFEIEKQEVFAKTWQFAVHESEVSEARSYAVGRIGDSEVLITRDREGELHAMRNVCIHRGAQLVDCAGHSALLRCPYHSWTYGLDGVLRAAPGFEADPRIEAGKARLSAVRFDRFGPLIFVNLKETQSSLADVIGPIDDVASPWTGLTHQETRRYPYDCNWKIAIENSLECYHCPVVHPGFATLIDTQNYVCEIFEFCASAGGSRRKSANPESGRIYETATDEGASDVQTFFIWPNLWLLSYPGPANLVVARWFPDGLDRSYCERSFFFSHDFPQEKRGDFMDYVDLIQRQDLKICADVYKNIRSGAFEHGFLRFGGGGLTEELIMQFQRWLVAALNERQEAAA
jgi:phenylpropionate dioxygenase-like ring-hydroxylating dioxygenase large terminal subunit